MAFMIESTFKGRGIIVEDCIASGTLTAGQMVALTKGAGKPTATSCAVDGVPDAIVVQGGLTTTVCKMARVFPGDVLKVKVTEADGTTALTAQHNTDLVALVGQQTINMATGALNLDGVTDDANGNFVLISFDTAKVEARVRIKA
jgi:hypothetical protein